jgi:transposase
MDVSIELTFLTFSSMLASREGSAMNPRQEKRRILRQARALNPQPQRVKAAVFATHPFFDPEDRVQVKYEMLRARELEGIGVTMACAQFGFSRESYRQILQRFRQGGILGLFGQKRGRKRPLKATAQIREFLRAERDRQSGASVQDLIACCRDERGVALSRRTVFRILAEEAAGKKKPKRRPRR